MRQIFRLYFYFVLLASLAACASPPLRFRDDSKIAFERIRVSGLETLFPLEAADFYKTFELGNRELSAGRQQAADDYYNLAVGKAELLEALYVKELKRREELARLEFELKRQAEAQLELERQQAREKTEELAREAARIKRLEAEKAEIRRRAERSRQEKDLLVFRHTVKRGETLPQIAAMQEVYGEASLWPLIYRANRDQISNPAVLWPGQVLRIPRNYDKTDISEARRYYQEKALR